MNENTIKAAALALPMYVSQKTVQALHIARVEPIPIEQITPGESWHLFPTDERYPPVRVSLDWISKHSPKAGGYWVRYEDGYTSYSPGEQFEAGCTPLPTYGIPEEQEPKYGTGPRGRLVKRADGVGIPFDEPVFVFRAKDKYAVYALASYADVVQNPEQCAAVRARITDFERFAAERPERMKEPDPS